MSLPPLVTLVVLAVTLDSHQRNLFLGWTAVFLVFVFGFAGCIIWSYNRDKEKLRKTDPYRDDHVVK
ncbi:MAG: hypothetical protein ACHP79_03775 [Terriglobales bacterium]